MTMVRKQVFISAEQNRLLKQRAKATRRPEAELIRAALDRELGIACDEDDWKAAIESTFGALADEEGFEERIGENRRRTRARLDQNMKKLRDVK